ncbi:hypothetical protein V3C99_007721 [Haemonchus contortus]
MLKSSGPSESPSLPFFKGRARFREIFRSWLGQAKKSSNEDTQCHTIFEKCDVPRRPAVVQVKEYKLKWKDGKQVPSSSSLTETDAELFEVRKTKDFQLAKKIMVQLRKSNILETMVSEDNLPIIKKFFKENLNNPTQKVIEIIDHALEICYNEVMFHQERYDLFMDTDMRNFLLNKENAKQCLLDVILVCPEFVPLMWGGESVGLPSEDEIAKTPRTQESREDVAIRRSKSTGKTSAQGERRRKTASPSRLRQKESGDALASLEIIKAWEGKGTRGSQSEKSSNEYSDPAVSEGARIVNSLDKSGEETFIKGAEVPKKATKRSVKERWSASLPKKASALMRRMKSKLRGEKVAIDNDTSTDRKTKGSDTSTDRRTKGSDTSTDRRTGSRNTSNISEELPKSGESDDKSKSSTSEERPKRKKSVDEKSREVSLEQNVKNPRKGKSQVRTGKDNLKTARETRQSYPEVRRISSKEASKTTTRSEEAQKSSDSDEKSRDANSIEIRKKASFGEKPKSIDSAERVPRAYRKEKQTVAKIRNLKSDREGRTIPSTSKEK